MRFVKISEQEFKDEGMNLHLSYDDIKLPKRATKCSAGYDIYSTKSFKLCPGQTALIPTGIAVELDTDKFLAIVPRSGLGFKYRVQLDNTIGIIDADYIDSDNGGHIFVKITNDSNLGKELVVNVGDAICQGIILPYFKVDDDNVTTERNGGFGSTSK